MKGSSALFRLGHKAKTIGATEPGNEKLPANKLQAAEWPWGSLIPALPQQSTAEPGTMGIQENTCTQMEQRTGMFTSRSQALTLISMCYWPT